MSVTLYGLVTCDTCRKARKWLDREKIAHEFVDYREHPVPAPTLKEWARAVGGWDKLVNKSSTTWRNLPAARRSPESDPEWTLLIKEYPALVRRPVAVQEGDVHLGFSNDGYRKLFLQK